MKFGNVYGYATIIAALCLASGMPSLAQGPGPAAQDSVAAAREVLQRLGADVASRVQLEAIPADNGLDVYEVEVRGGRLIVRGNTAVAMCRGLYDYLKDHGLGIVSWSGNRLDIPARWPDAPLRRVATPYRNRFYFNVVTYGYTLPYWTWERWEQELDWMALHGMNMPLAMVATEAIGERVWKKLGLTQEEIDAFYTGPAHLPWQRMGNITQHDGPLSASWHAGQVALQHKILQRMRELGIEPIVPAFAGFVPRGLTRVHPEVKLHRLGWGGFPREKGGDLLAPGTPLFEEIGKLYIQEYEKEFGRCRYYLADSFNEMQLPNTGAPVTEMLADYGDAIYRSIAAGNPDAVWVVQGWMLGYQRSTWKPENVKALLSKVPDDRMLILDEAGDYNALVWRNGMNYDLFEGFYGKPWAFGFIPNMGGKTAFTGKLDFYATAPVDALNSTNRGQLVGFGFAPEGIENNEVIYELLSDMGWRTTPANLDEWLPRYSRNRYGACPEAMTNAWMQLRTSCFNALAPHPRFAWQFASFNGGEVYSGNRFFQAVGNFLACADELWNSPLYRADAIEMAAIYLGLKAESQFKAASDLADSRAAERGLELLTEMDRLLESHPLHRLERWLDFVRAHGPEYEANARRIVTVWGPPIGDYAARMWSGLIRDYYRERMRKVLSNEPFSKDIRRDWEENWVQGSGVSKIEPFPDPLAAAVELVRKAGAEKLAAPPADELGTWSSGQVTTDWMEMEWPLTTEQLRTMKGVAFKHRGGAQLEIRWAAIVADGEEIVRDEHVGMASPYSGNLSRISYRLDIPANVQANNGADLRASVRGVGGTNSAGRVMILKDKEKQP